MPAPYRAPALTPILEFLAVIDSDANSIPASSGALTIVGTGMPADPSACRSLRQTVEAIRKISSEW
jgi:hypothetical protein